jgi:hypothetical protein
VCEDGIVSEGNLYRWNENQLRQISGELAKVDLAPDLQFSAESERAFANTNFDRFVSDPPPEARYLGGMLSDASPEERFAGDLFSKPWVLAIYPRGWFRISQVKWNEDYDALLRQLRAVAKGAPFSENVQFDSANYNRVRGLTYILYTVSWPGYTWYARFIRPIALHRQTQLACALARYRLKIGSFPDNLDALVPEFITTVRADPIDGAPMRYQRNADGGFDLWSIGPKGVPPGVFSKRDQVSKWDQDPANWVLHVPGKP